MTYSSGLGMSVNLLQDQSHIKLHYSAVRFFSHLIYLPTMSFEPFKNKLYACNFSVPGVIYLSPEIQETLPYTLVKLVPYKKLLQEKYRVPLCDTGNFIHTIIMLSAGNIAL